MKTRSNAHCLFLAGMALLHAPAATAAPIVDKFNDPSKWGKPFKASDDFKIAVADGRMNFTSGTTKGGGAGIPRKGPLLPTTKDWSIQADAHVHPFKLSKQDQYADVFIGAGKSGSLMKTHLLFEFARGKWGTEPDDYDIGDDVSVGGRDLPGLFNVNGLSSPDVSLRMDFSVAKQTITYLFDGNGAVGGYKWVKLGTANIASGKYDLKMKSKDTFTVFLAASSEFQKVGKGQAWLDNLRITIGSAAAPFAIAVQQPAGSHLTAGVSRKSFGTRSVGGEGFTRTFTIRNDGSKDLIGLTVTTDGANAADFKTTPPTAISLASGETTTFEVTFKPAAPGTRTAAIHIKSNDKDGNPFDVLLSGMGAK